jgi:hypothetical protein
MRPVLLVLAALAIISPARADFVLVSTSRAGAAAGEPASPPSAPIGAVKARHKARGATSEPAVAGFGDHVPLSFAIRQIVPPRFQVAFGESVNRDSPIDWKGGKPWRATLRDAISPLRLSVAVTGARVTIVPANLAP